MMGLKGSGKTKQLIELVRRADKEEPGDVIFVEKGTKLTYDIPHTVRLIDASQYQFEKGYDFFKGFISGMHSANYDITHIFIDSVLKIMGIGVDEGAEDFLDWCEEFSARENVKFTMTFSADVSKATDGIRKYLQ